MSTTVGGYGFDKDGLLEPSSRHDFEAGLAANAVSSPAMVVDGGLQSHDPSLPEFASRATNEDVPTTG